MTISCIKELIEQYSRGEGRSQRGITNQNRLHGMLLRLNVNLRSITAKDVEAIQALKDMLFQCSSIALPSNPCSLTRAHCVCLFCRLLELASSISGKELADAAVIAENGLLTAEKIGQPQQIGHSLLMQYSADLSCSLITCRMHQGVIGSNSETRSVCTLLQHPAYEVRLACIKWLRLTVRKVPRAFNESAIIAAIKTMVPRELNNDVLEAAVLLLCDLMDDDYEHSFFWIVAGLTEKHQSLAVRAATMELLGMLLVERNDDCEETYVKVVQDASDENKVASLRAGAAKSLRRFFVKESIASATTSAKLNLVLLTLLQDDDRDVRNLAAKACGGDGPALHPLCSMTAIFKKLTFASSGEFIFLEFLEQCVSLPGIIRCAMGKSKMVGADSSIVSAEADETLSDVGDTDGPGVELTNSAYDDKMFQIERSNMFAEELVILQLGLRAVYQLTSLREVPQLLSVDYLERRIDRVVQLLPPDKNVRYDIVSFIKGAKEKFHFTFRALVQVAGILPFVKRQENTFGVCARKLEKAMEVAQELHPTLQFCIKSVVELLKSNDAGREIAMTNLLFLLPVEIERRTKSEHV